MVDPPILLLHLAFSVDPIVENGAYYTFVKQPYISIKGCQGNYGNHAKSNPVNRLNLLYWCES